ncbi:hypothetical protein SUGI_0492280 [Cryptomeria japonica]|nr:hypothetical protein SUGI_0492280 [Cryptomeria japonica]
MPLWIQMYALPMGFWCETIFALIGNSIGRYIGVYCDSLDGKSIVYASIYVEMNFSQLLPTEIKLEMYNNSWIYQLDYEALSFICSAYHQHGHLTRFLPSLQNVKLESPDMKTHSHHKMKTFANQVVEKGSYAWATKKYGFVRQRKKKKPKRKEGSRPPILKSSNIYEIFNSLAEMEEEKSMDIVDSGLPIYLPVDTLPTLVSISLEKFSSDPSSFPLELPLAFNMQNLDDSSLKDVRMGIPE